MWETHQPYYRKRGSASYYRKRGSASYYRKRGSASYIVREWLLWVVERERDACDVIDITLKSRVIMHIIGSAEALPILCVRYFWWERERERDTDRQRRKWRHHCRAKIGRWVYTFPCQKFALGDELHFPLPKIRTFWFSLHTSHLTLLKWSPLWRWNSQWVLTFRCQNCALFVPTLSRGAIVLSIEKMNQINTKNYWK